MNWMRKSYVLPGVSNGTWMLRICVHIGPFNHVVVPLSRYCCHRAV
jgi:hypothetical protein